MSRPERIVFVGVLVCALVFRFVTLVPMHSLLTWIALSAGAVAAISPVTIKGTKFFDATGAQVYFKGI